MRPLFLLWPHEESRSQVLNDIETDPDNTTSSDMQFDSDSCMGIFANYLTVRLYFSGYQVSLHNNLLCQRGNIYT